MADVQESYPTPTTGSAGPEYIIISGAGVTLVKGNVSQASVSMGSNSSVDFGPLTATLYDADGTTSTGGTVNWKVYDSSRSSLTSPTGDANDVAESYPTGATFTGCVVNSGGFVKAYAKGVYIVEAEVVSGQKGTGAIESSSNTKSSIAYGQLILTVGA